MDSEPLSRNGSLVDNAPEESELWKISQKDPYKLLSITTHEFLMRSAVKGDACVLALSGDSVNPSRVGWENSPSDDLGKEFPPHLTST